MPASPFNKYSVARLACAVLLWTSAHSVAADPPGASSADVPPNQPAEAAPLAARALAVFQKNCTVCHGENLQQKELDLSSREALFRGSESGPVVVPGKPRESRLYTMLRDGLMPPAEATRLPEDEIAAVRAWIEALAPSGGEARAAHPDPVRYDEVIPIMLVHCTVCHGLRRQEGGLDLRTRESMMRGGVSGPAMVPGDPPASLLLRRIEAGEMPPRKLMLTHGVKPVGTLKLAKLEQWIRQGAPAERQKADVADGRQDRLVSPQDREYWAFQPPQAAPVPAVAAQGRVRNPIDAFLLRKLEANKLGFSPEADKLTLIRRAYFDLTGLPPEPEQARAFLADDDPRAYETMIDHLLASPRYGERWGRHWLDLAGYADSEGGKLSADIPRPHAYRYRDYVIRAFNDDKPYDRFLMEQIAGDELFDYENAVVITPEINDALIATGFMRMGPDSTSEREVFSPADRVDVIAHQLDILGSAVMGLTIKCARCHSHKYDPIPQRDYYRLMAVFKGAFDEYDWITPVTQEKYKIKYPGRYLPYVEPGIGPLELLRREQERELRNYDIDKKIKTIETSFKQRTSALRKSVQEDRLQAFPADLAADLKKMLSTDAAQRDETQKRLAGKYEAQLKVSERDLKDIDPLYRRQALDHQKRIELLKASRTPAPRIRALWDRGVPSPTYILRRGDPSSFGRLVGPGVPSVLTNGRSPLQVEPPWKGAKTTGRRLAFAKWLTQPDHPLTARVMVNRIWSHHFGAGLVKTTGNFGKTGAPPSHPALLDWLATRFAAEGWSIKAMHRLMMRSSAYRQASKVSARHEEADPENQLLSRMPLRRMEAEVLHDTMLLVSGRLDETPFGPASPVLVRDDGLVTPIATEKGGRRAVYVQQRRKHIPTLLESFDLPQMNPNCLQRVDSTVSLQALYLMNNAQVHELAAALAQRIRQEAGPDPRRQIEHMYWRAASRPPADEELRMNLAAWSKLAGARDAAQPGGEAEPAAAAKALTKLAHTMLNSASFLYID